MNRHQCLGYGYTGIRDDVWVSRFWRFFFDVFDVGGYPNGRMDGWMECDGMMMEWVGMGHGWNGTH